MELFIVIGVEAVVAAGAVVAWLRAKRREQTLERSAEGLRTALTTVVMQREQSTERGRDRLKNYLARKAAQRGS